MSCAFLPRTVALHLGGRTLDAQQLRRIAELGAVIEVEDDGSIVVASDNMESAKAAMAKGENLDLAIVLGGPLVDKVAAVSGVPSTVDDFEVLGSFYGHPAKLVRCETIDLLVVNLYPFEATVAKGAGRDEVIENIDIGGPSMVRSAAKNHAYVAIVTDPADYAELLGELAATDGATTLAFRKRLAGGNTLFFIVVASLIMPSIIDRSPLMVAISSGGKAPVLARLLREKLEALLPQHLGAVAAFAGSLRERVKARFASMGERRRFWERLLGTDPRPQMISLSSVADAPKACNALESTRHVAVVGFALERPLTDAVYAHCGARWPKRERQQFHNSYAEHWVRE